MADKDSMIYENTIHKKDIIHLIDKYSDSISRREVEMLSSYIFKCTRTELYIKNVSIDEGILRLCDSLLERRLSGEPLQYIIGASEFMGMDFLVNKDVFIPRPETEILVDQVLLLTLSASPVYDGGHDGSPTPIVALDLCTGCGNIAISLARLTNQVEIIATDISESALKVAQENSIFHGVDKRITFYKGDLFQALPFNKKYKFDIIVCNPPYIESGTLRSLQKEVRCEPRIALDGGVDGLEFYRRLATSAPHYLKKNGSLVLEIGFNQAQAVKDIFPLENLFEIRKVKRDLAGIDRVLWISLL